MRDENRLKLVVELPCSKRLGGFAAACEESGKGSRRADNRLVTSSNHHHLQQLPATQWHLFLRSRAFFSHVEDL